MLQQVFLCLLYTIGFCFLTEWRKELIPWQTVLISEKLCLAFEIGMKFRHIGLHGMQ